MHAMDCILMNTRDFFDKVRLHTVQHLIRSLLVHGKFASSLFSRPDLPLTRVCLMFSHVLWISRPPALGASHESLVSCRSKVGGL